MHYEFVVHPFDTFDHISPTIEIYFLTHDMYQLQFYIKTPICKFLFKINYESQLRKFFTTCIKMNGNFDTKVCYPPWLLRTLLEIFWLCQATRNYEGVSHLVSSFWLWSWSFSLSIPSSFSHISLSFLSILYFLRQTKPKILCPVLICNIIFIVFEVTNGPNKFSLPLTECCYCYQLIALSAISAPPNCSAPHPSAGCKVNLGWN